MISGTIDLQQVANTLEQGLDYVQRRTSNTTHPEYIPNFQVGRKRFVRVTDLEAWIEQRRVAQNSQLISNNR